MTPTGFSIDDLREILVICAGGAEDGAGGGDDGTARGDFADTSFDELGYDSLALMETAVRIERDHGVRIPDADVAAVRTPRDMLNLINGNAG